MQSKNIAVVFLGCALLMSCQHSTRQPTLYGPVESYQGPEDRVEQWTSGDNDAPYMRRSQRRSGAGDVPIYRYRTQGSCGGFPRVDLKTAPGFCVGLVYDGSGVLTKSRWAAPFGVNKVLLVDMGNWEHFTGNIYVLDFGKRPVRLTKLLGRDKFSSRDPARGILDRPNQIMRHKDGKYYVGGATGLYRFDPTARRPEKSVEVLISDLPSAGIHPLKSFTWDESGGLYINVGSSSNVCQNFTSVGNTDPQKNPRNFRQDQFPNCPEGENLEIGMAQIRRYPVSAQGKVGRDFKVYAKGLRNSVGLLWDPYRQVILQTENGRESIGKHAPELQTSELPFEEINIVKEGRHYGWPYCYNDNRVSPEWRNIDCAKFTVAQAFLPAHAAPLGMILHSGKAWPDWYKGRLLVSLHGFEKKGHRIVAMKRDDDGLPTGVPQSLVYGWDERGKQGVGKPVSMLELSDGSVLIVEDDNQNKVLRLVYDSDEGDGKPVQEIDQDAVVVTDETLESEEVLKARLDEKLKAKNVPPFVEFQTKVIDKYCVECHQPAGSPGVRLLKYDDVGNALRIRATGKRNDLVQILKGEPGYIPMPPQGWDTPQEQAEAIKIFESWIKATP